MSENKNIRLSKVAKEFNVGISTILEFLSKKGHTIENNPNTKISEDIYNIIVAEYHTEKHVKEESQKLGLKLEKKKSISAEENETTDVEEEEEVEDEIFIKDKHLGERNPELFKTTVEKAGVKVLGKIDLDDVNKKAKAKSPKSQEIAEVREEVHVQEKEIVEEAVKEEKTKEIVNEEIIEKTPVEDIKIKVVGKIELEEKPVKPHKEKEIKPAKHHKEKEEKPVIEPELIQKEDVQVVENETIIDEVFDAVETVVEEEKVSDSNDNFLKTEYQKLNGPTIIGKMDLNDFKSKKEKEKDKKKADDKIQQEKSSANNEENKKVPVASSNEDVKAKKRKRKRIKKENHQVNVVDDKKQHDNKSNNRNFIKPKEKVEPTEEEIQKQIKETLARLSGAGKSKASKYRRKKREIVSQHLKEELAKEEQENRILKVTEFISANELANLMNVPVTDVISKCMELGMFVSINQRLDAETISVVSDEFGFGVSFIGADDEVEEVKEIEDTSLLTSRVPIVTVMGHVDHGKTKLLDYIRKTNIVAGEAGGITQHIGAYEVTLESGKKITFLDTPGHEAFTAMRARGAKVTDIVIIVVAADDSVMPQTVEAINHAQAANVPIVIAINKIDKASANPDKVREELAKLNILVEDWGGKYQAQEISAKEGLNVDILLDKVLLEAEMLDLKANPNKPAKGTVIESALDKGKGYVAKVLVQDGSLRLGDFVLAGQNFGKAKAMYNERNMLIKEAGPSQPLLLVGLNGAPQAGDTFTVMKDEQEAKAIALKRQQIIREQGIRTQKHITLDEIGRRIAIGDFKELNIIVKGDVDGSVEALSDSLLKLSNNEVQVNVIHKSVGQVTETDVLLASASNAIIVGFQVRPSVSARKLAEKEQIDIRLYSIIYAAINEIKSAIEGMLTPEIEEKIICNIEIREVFKISKVGTVAGCMVLDGKINRKTKVRLIRDGIVVYTGLLGSLKRFKDDVKEVSAGYECGLNIENFNDLKVGDIIEGFEETEVKRTLS